MSSVLDKARKYEIMAELQVNEAERPLLHLSPRTGWMNDPNGFSFYKNRYHLFYQYHPYNTHWEDIHWGHAVSNDLITWEYLPAALAPDMYYDIDGCFSGSALTLDDGRQLLMYTGFARDENDIEYRGIQTQNFAIGDGIEYIKHDGNPVITADMGPGAAAHYDFRDPLIYRDEKGYHVIVSKRSDDGPTQIIMFGSEELESWEFERVLAENNDEYGRMWECPDYFALGGKKILVVSAMDMLADGLSFNSGNNVIYFVGHEDENGCFVREACYTMDYGIDFYATQSILGPDGRRIMVAWMQNPDSAALRTRKEPVFGQMCIPRELTLKDNRLYQWPVRELLEYRSDEVVISDLVLKDSVYRNDDIGGRYLDMTVELEPLEGEEFRDFRFRFAMNDRFYTEFRFKPAKSQVSLNIKYSGLRRATITHRDAVVRSDNGRLRFRLILDRYSAEVFVNDGETVLTTTFITDLDADRVAFKVDGAIKLNVTRYRLDR